MSQIQKDIIIIPESKHQTSIRPRNHPKKNHWPPGIQPQNHIQGNKFPSRKIPWQFLPSPSNRLPPAIPFLSVFNSLGLVASRPNESNEILLGALFLKNLTKDWKEQQISNVLWILKKSHVKLTSWRQKLNYFWLFLNIYSTTTFPLASLRGGGGGVKMSISIFPPSKTPSLHCGGHPFNPGEQSGPVNIENQSQ